MAANLQKTYSNDLTTAVAGEIWKRVKQNIDTAEIEKSEADPKVKKAAKEMMKEDPKDIPVTTNKDFKETVLKYFGEIEVDLIKTESKVTTLSGKILAYGGGIADIQKLIINQNELLENKLDVLLDVIQKKNELIDEEKEREKFEQLELDLEVGRDQSSTASIDKMLGKKGGGFNWILKLLFNKKVKRKLTRAILKKLLRRPRVYAKLAKRAIGRTVIGRTIRRIPGARQVGKNLLIRALKSRVVQEALVKKLGKEGAEKLTVKLAGKAIPGAATAYGAVEGLVRGAMGDWKGMMLSFGSAIPYAGYAFTAIDLMRDIDPVAYTKHIEGNFPPTDANVAAFFQEALGVTPDQYETGTPVQPQIQGQTDMMNPIGAALLSSSMILADAAGVGPTVQNEAKKLGIKYDFVNINLPTDISRVTKIASLPSIRSEEGTLVSEPTAGGRVSSTRTRNQKQGSLPRLPGGGSPAVQPSEKWDGKVENSEIKKILPQGNPLFTSGIGPRKHPESLNDYHYGWDFGVDAGSPVLSAQDGVVEQIIGRFGKVGSAVTIRHADGTANRYGHIDYNVTKDQKVKAGQKIGTVKFWLSSKGTDNSHLHFERFPANADLTKGTQVKTNKDMEAYIKKLHEYRPPDWLNKPSEHELPPHVAGGSGPTNDTNIDNNSFLGPLQNFIPSLIEKFSSFNEDVEEEALNPQPLIVVVRNNYNKPQNPNFNSKNSSDDFIEKYRMASLA